MTSITIQNGSFAATAGGYVSEFSDGVHRFRAKFKNGVRGLGIRDTVLVSDGVITSSLLGDAIEVVALVEIKLADVAK